MRILILDSYYERALEAIYLARPGLAQAPHDVQLSALMTFSFGTADFYSRGLRALGHEATETVVNARPLQRAWAREYGVRSPLFAADGAPRRTVLERIQRERPDVLYVQDAHWPTKGFLEEARAHVRLIALQASYPLSSTVDLSAYDVVFSSFPHYVERFGRVGVPIEYLRLGFGPAVLDRLAHVSRERDAVFVGTFTSFHPTASRLFQEVCALTPVELWGPDTTEAAVPAALRRFYRGEAWGLDMYRVLASARIVVNRHGEIAGRYANNMRMYEATGMGAMLVTEARDNLPDLFEPGREVVTYRSGDARDLAEKVTYYLAHEEERAAIARAGQARTLWDHTYDARMREVSAALERRLERAAQRRPRPFAARAAAQVRITLDAARLLVSQTPARRALRPLVRAYRRALPVVDRSVSRGHRLLDPGLADRRLASAWTTPGIAPRQRAQIEAELDEMYRGFTPPVFRAAAEAVRRACLTAPSPPLIYEVGCASGYYGEILSHLLGHSIRYLGLDLSPSLLRAARSRYPAVPFVAADATRLPIADEGADVLLSGCVILHVPDWRAAVAEAARVTRRACIFHRTPIVERPATITMTKLAYDVEVLEHAFSRGELEACFAGSGLEIEARLPVDRGEADPLGPFEIVTYVCRPRGRVD